MKRHLAYVVLASVWFLTGCSDPTQTDPRPDFTEATSWRYLVDSLGAGGMTLVVREDTVSIASSTFSQGSKLITMSDGSVATLDHEGSSYKLKKLGLITSICNADFPVPAQKGDTLTTIPIIQVKLADTVRNAAMTVYVKDVNVSITVPAGTFVTDEFAMSFSTTPGISNDYFIAYVSPQVGVVRKEYYTQDAGSLTMRLYKHVSLLPWR